MLSVKKPEEVLQLIADRFSPAPHGEKVSLDQALGRILFQNIVSTEFVPGFDRSTVDGFAVRAMDTFGCSDAVPAVLRQTGEISMGVPAAGSVETGTCISIPTGGFVPQGADAVVMLEYAEAYGDGTIGISRPVAPGENMIFQGDDVFPGKVVLSHGRKLNAADIGALAAMGITEVPVYKKPQVAIISTGDELVSPCCTPQAGQVRDVNSPLLQALCTGAGAEAVVYGILKDRADQLYSAIIDAAGKCDVVLVSGGSSVGMRDITSQALVHAGEILFHGIAMKPGKPTMLGVVSGTPVFGLPGHPVAVYFVAQIFVRRLIAQLTGRQLRDYAIPAILEENLSANHGRAQYTPVALRQQGGQWHAIPIRGKSGLITSLAASDGYLCVPRDCEGIAAGTTVHVTVYSIE